MSIPEFRADGWLPEGHHPATWEEIAGIFGGKPGSHRATVFGNLVAWRDALRGEGISGLLILDGSFISQKAEPGDFDCIFVYNNGAGEILIHDTEARDLLHYSLNKIRFGGDIFVYSDKSVRDNPVFCSLDGFDRHKVTREPKGVVEVLL